MHAVDYEVKDETSDYSPELVAESVEIVTLSVVTATDVVETIGTVLSNHIC